jgi:hypothetical protein
MMEALGWMPVEEYKEVVAKEWRAAVGPMLTARGSKG